MGNLFLVGVGERFILGIRFISVIIVLIYFLGEILGILGGTTINNNDRTRAWGMNEL